MFGKLGKKVYNNIYSSHYIGAQRVLIRKGYGQFRAQGEFNRIISLQIYLNREFLGRDE